MSIVFSPEDLVSCDVGNHGCGGGWIQNAWAYLESKGVTTDVCKPYTSGTGQTGKCAKTCADGSAI